MKTTWLTIVLLVFAASRIQGQVSQSGPPAIAGQGTVPVQDTPYAVVSKGANQQVWQKTTYETLPSGQTVAHIHKYTELATGLNFWDSTTGQWVESKEQIDILPNGTAAATQGQHQAYFPGNIAQGVIELVTPDGQRLRSRPLGLSYFDGTNSVLIAELKDSDGQVLGANQVIFTNAFTDFAVDLIYTYTKVGFEQDIILREQPPTPESFGLNPATARLQVLTEFFSPPQPVIQSTAMPAQAGLPLTDQQLGFGTMQMIPGRAFMLGEQATDAGVRVGKQWLLLDGRQFLVEEVPVEALVDELAQLPVPQTASTKPNVNSMLHVASAKRLLPAPRLTKTSPSGQFKQVAQAATPTRGLVLDYQTLNTSQTNYTFQGDTTYYISGAVYLSGTNNLIEGGAVLKYASNASVVVSIGQVLAAVQFRTSAYRPVIFTAKDDNRVGEIISGSTGNPTNYYANPALSLIIPSFAPTIANFRIAYAKQAMYLVSVSPLIANGQIVNCQNGISVAGGGGSLENVLFANVLTNFNIIGGAGFTAQNATFSGSRYLITQPNQYNSFSFANCIFVNVTNLYNVTPISFLGSYNGFYNSPTFGTVTNGSAVYPFQTIGAGSYYLTNGCVFFNQGTTNIHATLLAALKTKTTYPPIVYSNYTFSIATNFSPQAQRDTDVPDLGYHYDPLDYVFGGVTASSNLTFTAGTAVGWFELPGSGGPGYGISIYDNVILSFNGTAASPCTLARYSTVQEGGNGLWKDKGWLAAIAAQSLSGGYGMNPTNAAQVRPNFTRHAALAGDPNHYREYNALIKVVGQNSEFWNGYVGCYWVYLNFTNCLFDRTGVGVYGGAWAICGMRNCTMHGGNLTLQKFGQTWPVWIEECAFDGTTLQVDDNSGGNTNITYCDFNAFLTNADRLAVLGPHDVTNIISFNWQSSWLGNYYLPTNSSLINTGSVTADIIGLYHFTTQTNQVKETNSVVDNGYHYVAVNTNGIPIDTNGDGIPDYLQDANGNGLVDSGESPWTLGIITQPQSTNVVQGQNVTFSVVAGGIGPFTYQWRSNGVSISGANSSNYTKLVVQTTDAANYSVIVSNATAAATSSNASLAVTVPLALTNPPASRTVVQGTNVSFSVGVSGNYLVYQWFTNDVQLNNSSRVTGATNSTLTISNVVGSDAANYTVRVTNLFGSVISPAASLTVITNPWVATSPTNTTAIQADDVTFRVTATGFGLGYQWWLTNSIQTNSIPGATSASYTKLVVQTNDAGHYSVIITNLAGSTNASADLTVLVPPWIVQQPGNIVTNQGSNATFSVTAIGTTNLNYQWFKNGTNVIAGATSSFLTLTNVQATDAAGYSILVTNIAGTNFSAWAWLSVILTGGTTTNGWGGGSSPPPVLPVVSMISPTNTSATNPAVFLYGPPISIRASASSQYSYITNVVFYSGTNINCCTNPLGSAVPGANTKFALAWTNALPGTNVLKARAWDCNGNSNDSPAVYVIMDQPPRVSTVPANISLVWEGFSTNVWLTNYVSDDGLPYGVTNISWSPHSGVTTSDSYTYTPTNIIIVTSATFTNSGNYALTLNVSDGFVGSSGTCNVNVKRRPQIYFNSPTNNAAFPIGTPLVLNATAYDLDGAITNVKFYNGTNFTTIGAGVQSVNNTYTYAWFNAPVWTNLVSAVATDNDGLMSTSTVSVVMLPPLAVRFVSPTNGQLFIISPTNILLTAQAVSYIGATVTSVSFSNQFMNLGAGTFVTNSTWQLLWPDVTNGVYTLTVHAADNAGNTASNSVAITVNAMPLVRIVTPSNLQSSVEVTNIAITAVALDPDGTITNVSFFGETNLPFNVMQQSVTNFTLVWSNRTAGYYAVTAVAADNRGAQSSSEICVFKVTPTNVPPSVWIAYPTNGAVFADGSDVTITAVATNGSAAVTNVEFYRNGQWLGYDADSPYSINVCCWKPGNYTLVAKATDAWGKTSVSSPVNITVAGESPTGEGFWDPGYGLLRDKPPFESYFSYFGPLSIAVGLSGNLYAAGWGPYIGGISPPISIGNEGGTTNWQFMGTLHAGDDAIIWTGIITDGTNVYAGGEAAASLYANSSAVSWNGSTWVRLGNALPDAVFVTFAKVASDIYIGGDFTYCGDDSSGDPVNTNVQRIAKLDVASNKWVPVGNGITNGVVYAIAAVNNMLYVGGSFTHAGGNTNANYIARLENGKWTNLGSGILPVNGFDQPLGYWREEVVAWGAPAVMTLAACETNLFVGGNFTTAGGQTNANGIAVWNSREWQIIGNGVGLFPASLDYFWLTNTFVTAIAPHGNRIFVGGGFHNVFNNGGQPVLVNNIAMATWSEGTHTWTWSDLDQGAGGTDGEVDSCVIAEGPTPDRYDVYIGGCFSTVGSSESLKSGFARWRVGYPLPPGLPTVTITNPVSGLILTNTAQTNIIAIASSYTNIDHVEFFNNGQGIGGTGNDNGSYHISWNPSFGLNLLTAVAVDVNGLRGQSKTVLINVRDPAGTVIASNDVFSMMVNDPPTSLNVLANDTTSTTNKLRLLDAFYSISGVFGHQGCGGTVQVSYDKKSVIYTPSRNHYGTDIFVYSVTDGVSTNSAYGTVNVRPRPNVQITTPYDGQRFLTSAPPVAITTVAHDYDGTISNVTLFVNSTLYRTLTNANGTITTNWIANTPGFYTLVAVTTDNDGLTNASVPVTLVLTNTTASPHGPVATITNLIATISTTYGIESVALPTIRDGLFDLRGQAYDPDVGDPVVYAVLLFRPQDEDTTITHDINYLLEITTPYANVTPGSLNPQQFHIGGDSSGDLGTLDLTGIPDGVYDLVLRVRGGTDETNCIVRVQLSSKLKIGQFSFSEQDLILPVNGIPLTVTRTYNSLNPRSGAFGQSWTYALNDMDVQLDDERQDVTIGSDTAPWADDEESDNGLPKVVSVRTGGGWDVTLTLPDGRRATFVFDPFIGSTSAEAQWKAPPGVTATLKTYPDSSKIIQYSPYLHWQDDDNSFNKPGFENHDIPGWVLKTRDGTKYYITRGQGNDVVYQNPDDPGNYVSAKAYGTPKLTSIVQRTGDTISIADNGIFHYTNNGANPTRSAYFDRDGAGRITALRDPNAGSNGLPTVKYVYNRDNGNLLQVQKLVDRAAGTYTTVKYHYDHLKFLHYITSIEDPRGIPLARNEYDDSGKLTAVVDADGKRTEFIHSITNKMEVVIDRLGRTNTYVYDLRGNVTATTNALSQVMTMAYDANNNKTTNTVFLDGQPYATNSYIYDTNLNVVLVSTDPLGHSSTYTYNQYGQVLISVSPCGCSAATNYYDGATGNLIAASDAMGNTTSNFYNGALLVGSRDAIGTVTTNRYDNFGNLTVSATLASDTILSSNTFAYDLNGNRTNSTVWRQVCSVWTASTNTYIYDAMNRVVQTIDPDGGTNTVVYNEIGKQQATIDKLGRTTSYDYDAQGRLWRTTYPDLTTETNGYDFDGNRTASADRLGRVTTYVYDALDRVTQTIYSDNTTNITVYDGVGRVAQAIDARGAVTAFNYDVAGRRLAVTNAFGTSVAATNFYGYDANGNQTTLTDALGRTVTSVFDVLNRRTQVQYPDGTTTGTGYDAVGRRVAETNQDVIVTRFGYDGAGRLISVINAANTAQPMITQYQYDEAGNETGQIDALGRTNSFAYDSMGNRIAHWMPDTNLVERFGYDTLGNLIRYTNFTGVVITNQYDVMNRLTNRISVNGYKVSFTYIATGQRLSMNDPSGTTSYNYDNCDRLQLKTVSWNNGPSISLNYRYNANGSITNIWSSTANGVNLVYSYDPLSRLTNVLANGSATAEYGFDLVGNLQTMRYSNGVTNLYQYDSLNRLTNLVWKTNGTTIGSFAYQLGLTGNRTNLTETLNSQPSTTYAWSYDALYRLTNENISTLGNLGYGYDAVGNRTNRNSGVTGLTNQIFAFNTNDWLTIDSYDSNGNTTNSSSNFYQYDALNHLTNVNSGAILMTYDGDGNRASKKMNGTTTFYLLDDRNPSGYVQVLEEQTVTSTATNLAFVYNYGLSLISHKRVGNGAIRYYGLDGHGSTRFLTDGPTVTLVTDTLTYDAYGNLIAWTGGSAKKYLYCCEQWDQDLGMYLLRARYYAPGTGRFWAMDMYQGNNEDPLSLHKYLYCQGNPVDNTDPSGNDIGEMIGVMDIGGLISRNSIPSGVSGYTSIIVPTVDVHFDRLRSLGKSWHHAYLLLHQIGLPTIGFRGGPSIQGGHGYLTEKGSGLAVGGGFPDTDSDPGNPNNDVAKVGVTIPFTTYDHLRQEFQQVADHIESLHVPYHGIKGPNSNSFVKTLLVKNGLNAPRPPVWAPAWDVSIY